MGRRPQAAADNDEPEFPDAVGYLWTWFWDILDGCAANGMGPVSIGWRDLGAWCALSGEALAPWEAHLLVRLSALRASILSEPHELKN